MMCGKDGFPEKVLKFWRFYRMDKFMEIATEVARYGIENGHGGPFGAVIVKDGSVVACGHNHVVINNDPTCHGEVDAIRNACKKLGTFDLSGCELYTTHYPCPMCAGAIKWANIRKVYYGCTVEDTASIGFRDKEFYEEEQIEYTQIDRDACIQLTEDYDKMTHTMY